MTVANLLSELRAADVKLANRGGNLRVNAPAGVLTPPLLARIRDQKAEIIRLLASESRASNCPPNGPTAMGSHKIAAYFTGLPELFDAAELAICAKCGRLPSWRSITGVWRCEYCDPPTRAFAWLALTEKIRRRYLLLAQKESI